MTSADSDSLSNAEDLKKFLENSRVFIEKLDDSLLGEEEKKTKRDLLEFFNDDGYYTRMYPVPDEDEEAGDYDTLDIGGDDDNPKKVGKAGSERADELTNLATITGYLSVKTGWFSWNKLYALVYETHLFLYPKIKSEKPKVKYYLTGAQFKVYLLSHILCL